MYAELWVVPYELLRADKGHDALGWFIQKVFEILDDRLK